MPRVLVTGGARFIGSHTVDALLARGYDVRVLDLEALGWGVGGQLPTVVREYVDWALASAQDQRGFFVEVFREDVFREAGPPTRFVQLNRLRSVKNVVRGLHFQWDPPMGKLMRVTQGTAFLFAVDVRKVSPTLGKWHGVEISAESRKQVWAPAGFARGFCELCDYAEIAYLCTGVYGPKGESGIRWEDPAIGVEWPVKDPLVSEKDQRVQTLADWLQRAESEHFRYG